MKPADLLYSTVGRARRENTERTTGKSSPPGRRFRSPRVSSFVHGFGRDGEGMQMRAAFKLIVRPLSTLSFAMSTMGMLERV
jgi:hypothetical protein